MMGGRFPPIVKVGEVVKFYPQEIYAKVLAVEPIPGILIDFGAITAGSYKEVNNKTDPLRALNMPDSYFAQYRVIILTDNVELELYQPPASSRFTTRTSIARIAKRYISDYEKFWINIYGPLTEFYVLEDKDFKFKVYNVGTSDLTESKVLFLGWKFWVRRTEPTEIYKTIVVGALPSSAEAITKVAPTPITAPLK